MEFPSHKDTPEPSPIQNQKENVIMNKTENIEDIEDTSESAVDRALELMATAHSVNDEFDAFGYYVAEKLRSYSPETRRIVQELITAILVDAENGTYNYDFDGSRNHG